MIIKKLFNYIIVASLISILTNALFVNKAYAVSEETKNVLHSVTLKADGNASLKVVLHTSEKYFLTPDPVKQGFNKYVIFLPETENKVLSAPDLNKFENFINSIRISYIPLVSQNSGYTKITVLTASDDIELLTDNVIFKPSVQNVKVAEVPKLPEKTEVKIKTKEPAKPIEVKKQKPPVDIVKSEQVDKKIEKTIVKPVENFVDYKVEVESKNIALDINEGDSLEIPQDKPVKGNYLIFTVLIIVSLLAVSALGLIVWFVLNKKSTKAKSMLSDEIDKALSTITENSGIVVFTKNQEFAAKVAEKVKEKAVDLYIATEKVQEFIDNDSFDKNNILEFNLEEFYRHREFFKKLPINLSGVIFDIAPNIPKISNKNGFDFINAKKFIDLNYSNYLLMLDLLIKSFENKQNQFMFFAESGIKEQTVFDEFSVKNQCVLKDAFSKLIVELSEKYNFIKLCDNDFNLN